MRADDIPAVLLTPDDESFTARGPFTLEHNGEPPSLAGFLHRTGEEEHGLWDGSRTLIIDSTYAATLTGSTLVLYSKEYSSRLVISPWAGDPALATASLEASLPGSSPPPPAPAREEQKPVDLPDGGVWPLEEGTSLVVTEDEDELVHALVFSGRTDVFYRTQRQWVVVPDGDDDVDGRIWVSIAPQFVPVYDSLRDSSEPVTHSQVTHLQQS